MADYLLVPSPRHLVSLGDLDPIRSVPLTDAGLTPYHAIKPSLPKLVPGTTAVVIGVGGLGHLAIQMLRALSSAQVVALAVPIKTETSKEQSNYLTLRRNSIRGTRRY